MTSLIDVPQSGEVVLKSGRTRSFSTLEDYLVSLVDQGVVSDKNDLIVNHPEVILEIQRHWIRGGQTGCLFATRLANSIDMPWLDVLITGLPDHDEAYIMIDSAIVEAYSEKVEGIQFVMPEIDSSGLLLAFLQRISQRPNWRLCQIPTTESSVISVGLRWLFPNTNFVSWVLGFSSLESMPVTRRAPFTSIIMRLAGPGRCPTIAGRPDRPIDHQVDRPSVHLADLSDGLSTEDKVRKYWRGTQIQKEEILAGKLEEGARARVTFSLDPKCQADLDECTSANADTPTNDG